MNFSEVQILVSVSILSVLGRTRLQLFTDFTKSCILLGNVVSSTSVVTEINQKYRSDFRDVQIPNSGSFMIAIAMYYHRSSQKFEQS